VIGESLREFGISTRIRAVGPRFSDSSSYNLTRCEFNHCSIIRDYVLELRAVTTFSDETDQVSAMVLSPSSRKLLSRLHVEVTVASLSLGRSNKRPSKRFIRQLRGKYTELVLEQLTQGRI
jgi:hypothetical protein